MPTIVCALSLPESLERMAGVVDHFAAACEYGVDQRLRKRVAGALFGKKQPVRQDAGLACFGRDAQPLGQEQSLCAPVSLFAQQAHPLDQRVGKLSMRERRALVMWGGATPHPRRSCP
jgi:hypothetical protein